jgi:manganese oxidase
MGRAGRVGITILFLLAAHLNLAENLTSPLASVNDNRIPAGQVRNGTLTLRLELRGATWSPESDTGIHRDVYAFAEEGHEPQIPGPLLRVPQGTVIHATLHNRLPEAAKVYGLHRHPGDAKDAIPLAPGELREVQFEAGEPGTYFYWATTANRSLADRSGAETQLSGAFIVDPTGAAPHDRIVVVNLFQLQSPGQLPSINGKSWPYSERMTVYLKETVRWRVINVSSEMHGMHLHGFYFTVTGAGDGERYEHYADDQQRKAVTESLEIGHVFDMTWSPDRPGNWLFHCHMVVHMSQEPAKDTQPAAYSDSSHDHSMGMAGLVIGITVLPGEESPKPAPTNAGPVRKLQLVISDNPAKVPLYTVEVVDPAKPAAPDPKKATSLLGPPLVLTRDETTEIEVKNQCSIPTTIHWHGIELESYYDGVVGWTGSGQQTSPPVAPGTSFIARMTPPRAGTFIYHTHWHDGAQLVNGLYGPLIVLEPGEKYDPERDITAVFGTGIYAPFGYLLLVNGHPQPDPIQLHTGMRYRLRLINITDNISDLRVRLTSQNTPVQWKIIAKDGADFPAAQMKTSTADMGITVGETYDVEYESLTTGVANLEAAESPFPPAILPLQFKDAK